MDKAEAFFEACYEDRLAEVRRLLRATPGLIRSRRIGGRTPLHQAAFGGAKRVVQFLIDRGADVDAATDYGWVPLHYAAAPATAAVARLLVAAGARVDPANDDGDTPLHLAADFGKLPMARLLLRAGADPNARDAEGKTPADYAAPRSELARCLTARGGTRGQPTRAREGRSEVPDYLAGLEGEVQGLLDAVAQQWGQTGATEQRSKQRTGHRPVQPHVGPGRGKGRGKKAQGRGREST